MTSFEQQIIESTTKALHRAAFSAASTPSIDGKVTKVTVAALAAQDLQAAAMALPQQFDATVVEIVGNVACVYVEGADPLTILSIMWELADDESANMQVEAIG